MKDYSKYIVYYPESVKAIKEFRLDTGAGLAEAKAIIDDVFDQYEKTGDVIQKERAVRGKEKKEKTKGQKATTNVLKSVGVAAGVTTYVGLGSIFKLTSKYMKKKK